MHVYFFSQDDFDSLRPLCYPDTDVFLVCFSVVVPASFHNVRDKWLPEIRRHSPSAALVLVGTQCDLRDDVKELINLDRYGEKPITEEQALATMRSIGALQYVECSALTQLNMKQVFDSAILAALERDGVLGRIMSGKKKGKKRWKMGKRDSSSKQTGCWRKFCCFS